jgi:hypothetical protein
MVDYQPGDRLKEGTQIFILLSDQKKKKKKVRLHTSTATVCVDVVFHRNFSSAVEQTNIYYQQHLDRQAGPSCRLPDIKLPDTMTFIALALQMGHERHYMTTSQDLDSYTLCFMVRP